MIQTFAIIYPVVNIYLFIYLFICLLPTMDPRTPQSILYTCRQVNFTGCSLPKISNN